MMIPLEWLEQAAERIEPHIRRTPFTYDAQLDLFLKWENKQVTGSFKVRGALNKTLNLQRWEMEKGLVTASAGNHGQGVALAGKLIGTSVTVFCSHNAVPDKIAAMRDLEAEVVLVHGGYGEAEKAGLEFAGSSGSTWVSPYNDPQVIAGQGTIALEIFDEHPELKNGTWLIPAGGGGLIAGVGIALKSRFPDSHLVAVQSEASPFLNALFRNRPQDVIAELPSLADGLAGRVEDHSVTISIVRQIVDGFILVQEEEIAQAIAYAWYSYGEVIEGSAAVGLAAILSGKIEARPVITVISGGNIQPEVHDRIIKTYNRHKR